MNHRQPRREPTRSQSALVHRGPGAHSGAQASTTPLHHAPNAALLIDFDNVTMGIRSDLGKELRNLLSSDIIKGKVAVQRAYADWRRYPQYIVPLTEASIDLIYAPAYGSSKKNATDIRLAIDAMELVFSRPEIGTIILLSGDSDFSSLVIKLKEYGKYVIGVGIRESSSDLLVMNCDEYYSYNALAGLVKSTDEEPTRKYDPWELVKEAITRMKQNRDVMRSDRLKQVMQEIDPTFDEKNLGISKFSKFCQEAASKGLLTVRRLENGQLEVDVAGAPGAETPAPAAETPRVVELAEERGQRRGRRGGRGRGERERRPSEPAPVSRLETTTQPSMPALTVSRGDGTGSSGERLTRDEAFDLLRRAVSSLAENDNSVRASVVRERARELLGRDSESLSERNFVRILKDAHDADVVDLRRRGDDFEVARAETAPSVSDQLAKAQPAPTPKPVDAAAPRFSLRGRSSGARSRMSSLPPELLSLGVVETAPRGMPAISESDIDTRPPPLPPLPPRRLAEPRSADASARPQRQPRSPTSRRKRRVGGNVLADRARRKARGRRRGVTAGSKREAKARRAKKVASHIARSASNDGGSALARDFYARQTELVARDLLGCVLECHTPDGIASGRIVETEAYLGEHDLACHAAAGHTRRTAPLYGPPGTAYVYFIYGVHWCFNAVTREEGQPSAVLVRALEPLEGLGLMNARRRAARREFDLTNGPGKLCAALGIDIRHNELRLDRTPIRISEGMSIPRDRVVVTPRIGISESADWPLRWYVEDCPYVSRTPKPFPRLRPDR